MIFGVNELFSFINTSLAAQKDQTVKKLNIEIINPVFKTRDPDFRLRHTLGGKHTRREQDFKFSDVHKQKIILHNICNHRARVALFCAIRE